MARARSRVRLTVASALVASMVAAVAPTAFASAQSPDVATPLVRRIPTTPPEQGGDRLAPTVEGTYPWFSTYVDLEHAGFVEEEFYVSGEANAFDPQTGRLLHEDVPYLTRIIVRRPLKDAHFNGTVLAEWQNVSAGYDLDALWGYRDIVRDGYAWVGISAQRVGVNFLRSWSPTRYGELDVTAGGTWTNDQLSYDVFAQAAKALVERVGDDPMGGLAVDTILGIGASQSAGRMVQYYDLVLPQTEAVFDGYAFVVGSAPATRRAEPIFHILSETDVGFGAASGAPRAPDTDGYRRWEVAGSAHSGWNGQEYRLPLQRRDNPAGVPVYDCDQPPFSRVPLHHVLAAAYDHLVDWVETGAPPPIAPRIDIAGRSIVRDDEGVAVGGIRLSQVEVPIAFNDGTNSGQTFCVLFGEHRPYDDETLDQLYPSHGRYVSEVVSVDRENVNNGFIDHADAIENRREAAHADVGR
jgi:hypothetical protein